MPQHVALLRLVERGAQMRSGNKMGAWRKKRKRRKKKLPQTYSSFLVRGGAREEAEDEHEDAGKTIEYVRRADEFRNIPTVQAESLNAVQSMEDAGYTGSEVSAPYMKEMGKFIEEKVSTGEEIILKSGMPAFNLYNDRTHL